jgi:nucleoside diphosphate kinase homolog 5
MILAKRVFKKQQFALMQRMYSTSDSNKESTFAMIKPDGINHLGAIFGRLHREGFTLRELKMSKLNKPNAKNLFEDIMDKEFYPLFSDYITSGPIIGMRLQRLDAVNHWRSIMGPTDSEEARLSFPDSIRALYGKDNCVNVVHGAETTDQVIRASNMFFSEKSLLQRHQESFPNALFALQSSFVQNGKLEGFFEHMKDSGLTLNAMRLYSYKDLQSLGQSVAKEFAEKQLVQDINERLLMVELSHPKGYHQFHDQITRLETFTGVQTFRIGKSKESVKKDLFL